MYINTYICICIYIYMYMYIYIYTCICIYIYVYVNVNIYIYIYSFANIFLWIQRLGTNARKHSWKFREFIFGETEPGPFFGAAKHKQELRKIGNKDRSADILRIGQCKLTAAHIHDTSRNYARCLCYFPLPRPTWTVRKPIILVWCLAKSGCKEADKNASCTSRSALTNCQRFG